MYRSDIVQDHHYSEWGDVVQVGDTESSTPTEINCVTRPISSRDFKLMEAGLRPDIDIIAFCHKDSAVYAEQFASLNSKNYVVFDVEEINWTHKKFTMKLMGDDLTIGS